MAIQRKPIPGSMDADSFIAGAPDGVSAPMTGEHDSYDKGVKKGNKRQISLTIDPQLLRRVDELAKKTGQARAAIINLAIYRALEGEIF